MLSLSSLALVCVVICCGCTTREAAPDPAIAVAPVTGAVVAEPRGFVGETCPPALAAKGYC